MTIKSNMRIKEALNQERAIRKLRKAKDMITAAENYAMAVDGPVSPTREVMTNEGFDRFARYTLAALKLLESQ